MAESDPAAPLCVTFRITLADYRSGVRRLTWALLPVKAIFVVALLTFMGGVASALLAYQFLAIVLLAVSVIYAAMLAWVLFIRAGQVYHRRADLRGEQTWCFSDSEVSMTFVSGDSRLKWSYFVGLLETKDVYLLRHPLKQLGTIIPKRALAGPGAEARFRRLAQQIAKPSQPPA
jgi:hypothetical protein